MSVKYTRIPMTDWSDPESGSAFTYGSAFSYDQNLRSKYKSAFTYSDQTTVELASITDFEPGEVSWLSSVGHLCVTVICFVLYILTFPVSVWFSFKSVPNFERIVVFRLGHLKGVKGPGCVFVLPVVDKWHKVDVRIKAFNVPPKQVLTGDGAVIEMGADVFYRISDVEKSITHVQNLDQSTRILVQTALLNILVRRNLADIVSQRVEISNMVQEESNKASEKWGVEICRIELSQVKILRNPAAKAPPTVFMPPGMFGGGGGQAEVNPGIPEALQHLASAFLAAQGHSQGSVAEEPSPAPCPDLLKAAAARAEEEGSEAAGEGTWEGPTLTPEEILQAVQSVINESLVQRVAAVYNFQLSGDDGGVYYLDLRHGRGSAGSGMCPTGDSDATLMLSVADLQAMFAGRVKPFQAYMNGRLRVSGDLAAAMRLEEVVKRIVGK